MTIEADREKYFWLFNDWNRLSVKEKATTHLPPETFANSRVTPLIDMYEYMEKFREALDKVGMDIDPKKNAGDFIYICGWWIGLLGGRLNIPNFIEWLISPGPRVTDKIYFNVNPHNSSSRLIDILKAKAKRGVDVRVMGWINSSLLSTDPPDLGPARIPELGAGLAPGAPVRLVSIDFEVPDRIVAHEIQANKKFRGIIIKMNSWTMNSIKSLRNEPALAKSCILSVIGHPAGSMHIKGAVIGSKPDTAGKIRAIAFTGGMDLVQERWAKLGHQYESGWVDMPDLVPDWHDVQAAIEGRAAQGFYDHFRNMWHENLARKKLSFYFESEKMDHFIEGTEEVPERVVEQFMISSDPPVHHVQSLRTIPAFHIRSNNIVPVDLPISYTHEGIFEIKSAWHKAILAAERYIYMEDQWFKSRDIMDWINQSIRTHTALKVILIMSSQNDPNEPQDRPESRYLLHDSFDVGLLGGLNETQKKQIRIFNVFGKTTVVAPDPERDYVYGFKHATMTLTRIIDPPFENPAKFWVNTNQICSAEIKENLIPDKICKFLVSIDGNKFWKIIGNKKINTGENIIVELSNDIEPPANATVVKFSKTQRITVHSKVTLIDDKWALIGSANHGRRSLYTDWEHSIAFMDASADESKSEIKKFRARLWAEHFQRGSNFEEFKDLDIALKAWAPDTWITTPAVPPEMPTRPKDDLGFLENVPLLFPNPNFPEDQKEVIRYNLNTFVDVDSRDYWGLDKIPRL